MECFFRLAIYLLRVDDDPLFLPRLALSSSAFQCRELTVAFTIRRKKKKKQRSSLSLSAMGERERECMQYVGCCAPPRPFLPPTPVAFAYDDPLRASVLPSPAEAFSPSLTQQLKR